MSNEMEARVNGATNQAVCNFINAFEALDKKNCGGHVHYGCAWVIREDKVFHVCNEQKREWEIK